MPGGFRIIQVRDHAHHIRSTGEIRDFRPVKTVAVVVFHHQAGLVEHFYRDRARSIVEFGVFWICLEPSGLYDT